MHLRREADDVSYSGNAYGREWLPWVKTHRWSDGERTADQPPLAAEVAACRRRTKGATRRRASLRIVAELEALDAMTLR